MVEVTKYVPIVKWKAGEKLALKEVDSNKKKFIIPLIELVNDEGDTPPLLTKDIQKYWPDTNTAYVDVHYRPTSFALNALHNLAEHSNGVDLIPVVRTDTSLILHEAIKSVALAFNNGVAVRLVVDEGSDFEIANSEIEATLKAVAQSKHKSDLIIDLLYINDSFKYSETIKSLVKSIDLKPWRRVIVSSGVFPDYLTDFTPNEDNFLPRSEWQFWDEYKEFFSRETIYSDYTCRHPIYYPKPGSPGSKSLRYSLEERYQVFRGVIQDKPFKRLVHALNAVSLYGKEYPATFSWGDRYIHEKAAIFTDFLESGEEIDKANLSAGSESEWVSVTVNHHIAVVLKRNLKI